MARLLSITAVLVCLAASACADSHDCVQVTTSTLDASPDGGDAGIDASGTCAANPCPEDCHLTACGWWECLVMTCQDDGVAHLCAYVPWDNGCGADAGSGGT